MGNMSRALNWHSLLSVSQTWSHLFAHQHSAAAVLSDPNTQVKKLRFGMGTQLTHGKIWTLNSVVQTLKEPCISTLSSTPLKGLLTPWLVSYQVILVCLDISGELVLPIVTPKVLGQVFTQHPGMNIKIFLPSPSILCFEAFSVLMPE